MRFLAVVQKRTANCRERVYDLPVRRDRAIFARKQGWAGRYPSSRRSPQPNPGKPPSIQAERERGTLSPFRENHHVWQFSGLLLVLSLYSYHVRELLVCWLFFTSIFICVTLLILIGLLGVHAGERLTVRARATARMTPVLALAYVKHSVRRVSHARELK